MSTQHNGLEVGGAQGIRIGSSAVTAGGLSVQPLQSTRGTEAGLGRNDLVSRLPLTPDVKAGLGLAVEHGALVRRGLFAIGALGCIAALGSSLAGAHMMVAGLLAVPSVSLLLVGFALGPVFRRVQAQKELDFQREVLELAASSPTGLTVCQVALKTGKTDQQADRALTALAATGRAEIDNDPDSGVLVFRFPELALELSSKR